MHRRVAVGLLTICLLLTSAPALGLPPGRTGLQQPSKRLVVLVGLPGSGKTTFANSLSSSIGAPRHGCGDIIRKWVKDRGLRYTPANDREAARYFARRPGTLARQLASRIEQSPEPLHIVDGVRSVHDMKVLRDQFDVRVVALSLPRAERYRRLLLRQRFADTDEHYLRDRDRREIGLGVLHVLRHPFRRVDNSGRVEALEGIASRLGRELDASWRGAR